MGFFRRGTPEKKIEVLSGKCEKCGNPADGVFKGKLLCNLCRVEEESNVFKKGKQFGDSSSIQN